MNRRALAATVAALVTASGVALAGPASAAKAARFDYGTHTSHYYLTRTFVQATDDGVSDYNTATSRMVGHRAVCADYTLQLFDDLTGLQILPMYQIHCGQDDGTYWSAPKGRYFVLVTVLHPRRGATYVTAGTVLYHGASS